MDANDTWDLTRLRRHAGKRLLLGNGGVAIIYTLRSAGRVRVTFFVYQNGDSQPRATETGTAQALLDVLRRYASTGKNVRRRRVAAVSRYEPTSPAPRKRSASTRRPRPPKDRTPRQEMSCDTGPSLPSPAEAIAERPGAR